MVFDCTNYNLGGAAALIPTSAAYLFTYIYVVHFKNHGS